MNHNDFFKGAKFKFDTRIWECTDVGTRTVIARQINTDESDPVAESEHVINENNFAGCNLIGQGPENNEVYKNIPPMKLSPHWDLSQERVFIETLLNQRFNFMLVFFSLVIAGAINARTLPFVSCAIAGLGFWICKLISKAIARAQEKLDIILAELSKDHMHPVAFTDRKASQGGSRRRVIGVTIPKIACNSLPLISVAFFLISIHDVYAAHGFDEFISFMMQIRTGTWWQ